MSEPSYRYNIHFRIGADSETIYIETVYAPSLTMAIDELCRTHDCTKNDIYIRRLE